jgi:hypothetical protein
MCARTTLIFWEEHELGIKGDTRVVDPDPRGKKKKKSKNENLL